MAAFVKPKQSLSELYSSMSEKEEDTVRRVFHAYAMQVYRRFGNNQGLEKTLETIEELWNNGYIQLEKIDSKIVFKVWTPVFNDYIIPMI